MTTKATIQVPGLKVTVPLAANALPRDLVPMEGPAREPSRKAQLARELRRRRHGGQSLLLSEPQRYSFALAFSRAAASARTDSGSSLNRSRQPEQQTQ
jgi:hypothetical protein